MYLLKKQQQKNLILKVYKASTYELEPTNLIGKPNPAILVSPPSAAVLSSGCTSPVGGKCLDYLSSK